MRQLSILSVLVLVVLFAIVFALFARIHHEAIFYVTGPVMGSLLAVGHIQGA
jgi:hypothetical protein